jgi:uncharacterized membrane protein YgdD (TMEM256/DUF423 family)
MHRGFIKTAALLGAIAVMLGAFAAHALKQKMDATALAIFETGVRYQFYHVFALLATGIIYKDISIAGIVWAGRLFIAGIVIFSGSLYALSFIQGMPDSSYRWIGAITPFGGAAFIAGWIMLFISFYNRPVLNS